MPVFGVFLLGFTFFSENRKSFFWVLFCGFICLLPVLNFFPLTIGRNVGHERFLTLPLVFFSISIGFVVDGFSIKIHGRIHKILAGLIVFIWLAFCFLNAKYYRNVWVDDVALWEWAYRNDPDSSFVQNSLANAALQAEDYSLAGRVLEASKINFDSNLNLRTTYGSYLILTGNIRQGIDEIELGLSRLVDLYEAAKQVGFNMDSSNIKNYAPSLYFVYSYSILSEAYAKVGDFDKSLFNANRALFFKKDHAPSLLMKSFYFYRSGDFAAGDEYFEMALSNYMPALRLDAKERRDKFLKDICDTVGKRERWVRCN